jgi:hypothetical protein
MQQTHWARFLRRYVNVTATDINNPSIGSHVILRLRGRLVHTVHVGAQIKVSSLVKSVFDTS